MMDKFIASLTSWPCKNGEEIADWLMRVPTNPLIATIQNGVQAQPHPDNIKIIDWHIISLPKGGYQVIAHLIVKD